jgi:hypothetical protein
MPSFCAGTALVLFCFFAFKWFETVRDESHNHPSGVAAFVAVSPPWLKILLYDDLGR